MKRPKKCIICGKEHNNPFPYCSNECWLEHGRRNTLNAESCGRFCNRG